MCSNSMRALWSFRSRLWRNLGRSETYMCAEGNPLQLLWGVAKEAKIGRTIGARAKARAIPPEGRNKPANYWTCANFCPA